MGMDWSWDKSEPVTRFSKFGCPKCGAKHKYGHRRKYIDCWRCWYTFSPSQDARRYEEYRLTNLSEKQRAEALKNIRSRPPWYKNTPKRSKKPEPKPEPKLSGFEKLKKLVGDTWKKLLKKK